MQLSASLLERFWSRVAEHPSGCLLWTGTINKTTEYGVLSIATGVTRGAHQVAFYIQHGRWADRLRHTCDVRACVNHAHLVEGTQAQNMQDKVQRGRQARNETHGVCRLTNAQVSEMRVLRAQGSVLTELAARFGTSVSNTDYICRGVTRK